MTNLLNLEEYDNLKKEKALQQVAKNNWKYYREHKKKRPLKKMIMIKAARKSGISIH